MEPERREPGGRAGDTHEPEKLRSRNTVYDRGKRRAGIDRPPALLISALSLF